MKHESIEPLTLSVNDAAKALGVTRPDLSALMNQRAALSPEMALRTEKVFGVAMDTLMRMQNSFDIAQARKRAGEIKVTPYKCGNPGDPSRALAQHRPTSILNYAAALSRTTPNTCTILRTSACGNTPLTPWSSMSVKGLSYRRRGSTAPFSVRWSMMKLEHLWGCLTVGANSLS